MQRAQTLLSALLLSTFLLVPAAFAQNTEEDGESPHSIAEDAWAIQFGVSENFTLDSFEGSAISLKRHTSATNAWQIGLTLNGSYSYTDLEEGYQEGEYSSDNGQYIGLLARYLTYPLLDNRPLESIQLYAGAGPEIIFRRSELSQDAEDEGMESERSDTNVDLRAGVSGVVGAEWFVKKRISLTASYGLGLFYTRRTQSRDGPGIDTGETTNGVRLDAQGVQFGVSVYF